MRLAQFPGSLPLSIPHELMGESLDNAHSGWCEMLLSKRVLFLAQRFHRPRPSSRRKRTGFRDHRATDCIAT